MFANSTDAELAAYLLKYAEAQDHMAARSNEDREHWHHVALRDVMNESAKRLNR